MCTTRVKECIHCIMYIHMCNTHVKEFISQVWSGACAHMVGWSFWGGARGTDEVMFNIKVVIPCIVWELSNLSMFFASAICRTLILRRWLECTGWPNKLETVITSRCFNGNLLFMWWCSWLSPISWFSSRSTCGPGANSSGDRDMSSMRPIEDSLCQSVNTATPEELEEYRWEWTQSRW